MQFRGRVSLHQNTEANIAAIKRYLEGGKCLKEIAHILNLSHWAVLKIVERFPEARLTYLETHTLRYPEKELPTEKIAIVLKQIVQ